MHNLHIFRPVQASKLSGPVVTVQIFTDRLSKWKRAHITDIFHILAVASLGPCDLSLGGRFAWAVQFMHLIYLVQSLTIINRI